MRFLAIPLALALLLGGCGKKKEAEAEPIVPVQVTPVKLGSIQRVVTGEGVLFPRDQAGIMPKISAPVKKFYVNRGDHVRQGQLLAVLENRDLAASAAENRATVTQAQATYQTTTSSTVPEEVTKAQSDVQSAKQALDAAQKLLANREDLFRQGALARKLVDDAQVAYAQAKSTYDVAQQHRAGVQNVNRTQEVKSAEGQLQAARARLQGAEAQLSYSEVRSPINGVVTDRSVYAGEMATAGSPLLTVMDTSSVVARVNVPQSEALYIKAGYSATLLDNDQEEGVPGRVTIVSPALTPNSTTVEVWIQAANPGARLRPGGTVHVNINADTANNTPIIPASAIVPSQDGTTTVMVVGPDSVAHERKIDAGIRLSDQVQVVKGVNPGDQVVTTGGLGLQDGAKVSIQKPGEKGEDAKAGDAKDDEKGAKPETGKEK